MSSSSIRRTLATRVLETFVAPRALFSRIRDNAPWFGVLALSTLVAVVAAATRPEEYFLEQMQEPETRRGEPVEITSSPGEIVRYGRYLAMLSAAIGHPIIAFTIAGLLVLLFTVVGAGRGSFLQYLSVTAHALLIPALGTVLLLSAGALLGRPVQANLSFLAPGADPQDLVYRVLEGLDLFLLWMLMVIAMGVAALDGRRSWKSAAALLVGLYLVLDLVTAWATRA